jgi:metal-responsive CopG/Arc/MetJ family transcriptional regulator
MKTIAITMDEATLERVDRLVRRGDESSHNRSQLIREAVRAHVARLERLTDDEREGTVVRRHRGRLARQASALVREQAKP